MFWKQSQTMIYNASIFKTMAQILKTILVVAYTTIIFRLLKIIFINKETEIIELNYKFRNPAALKILRDLRKYGENASWVVNYKQPIRLPTDLRFILKYTIAFQHYSSSIYKNGQAAFLENNCSYSNCFLTNNKYLLANDVRNFDAILFDVENDWDVHPYLRADHQKYIFTASESADNYPICSPIFNDYYNLTWTYRLDSDISWTYLMIVDKQGNRVGPKIEMTWIEQMKPTTDDVKKKLSTKRKAAAWFVSNCLSKSGRNVISRKIHEALGKYGYGVDVYGVCGNMTCPRDQKEDCLALLEEDYYFYFSFENSLSEDYVTEKLLYPLKHFAVPVVFGGANYSRFVPPGSYLNAMDNSPEEIAELIVKAIKNKDIYYDYFRWHNHYAYRENPEISDACALCKIINEYQGHRTINNFTKWWFPCGNRTIIPRPVVKYTDVQEMLKW